MENDTNLNQYIGIFLLRSISWSSSHCVHMKFDMIFPYEVKLWSAEEELIKRIKDRMNRRACQAFEQCNNGIVL